MSERERNLFKASLAEKAERYDDLLDAMKKISSRHIELTFEERSLLAVAYHNLISPRRSSLRIIKLIQHKEENKGNELKVALVKNYRKQIEKELRDICLEALDMVRRHYIHHFDCTIESKVLYFKMRGDYNRYLAELSNGCDRGDFVRNSHIAYDVGNEFARRYLSPTQPIFLELALNRSAFYYEILNSPDEACRLAKDTIDKAIAKLDSLSDDINLHNTKIIKMLRCNLTMWTRRGHAAGDGEEEDNDELQPSQLQPDLQPTATQLPES